ncbi:MAG: hypothetical protein WC969_05455 [Elusimicrobiota bacterium]|jgi:hypothetical protein
MKKSKKTGTSDAALRRYYDASSTLAAGGRIERVGAAFARPRRLVALRIDEEALSAIRRIALAKGLNYSTLMRMWITERLRRESPPAISPPFSVEG